MAGEVLSLMDSIDYWHDPEPRSGAANMAVDQLLLESCGNVPVLRTYAWFTPTVSFGYFIPLAEVSAAFPDEGLDYIRRWTGGGIVDHRSDVTYTLAIPRGHDLAQLRGAESYRVIHQLLADVLSIAGESAKLVAATESAGDGGLDCFTNPVEYDIKNAAGAKLAGAGQRRSRHGLLHQGSVITSLTGNQLGAHLARALAENVRLFTPEDDFFHRVSDLCEARYSRESWQRLR